MDNAEEVLQALEEFSKLKPKEIPKELEEYLGYVAKSGDPVYQWHLVKHLFHEKLLNVITEFYETSPTIDLPPCPNVDPFNYERMKTSLLERLDTFTSAPFTIQRICELLTNPRKQYNRVDKFMRAIEKNILVVSTREPGVGKRLESDQTEAVLNGIPDSKINEDRTVNVCSDNLQFNNSNDSSQVPVENAVNACIIQEQIEIVNSGSSSGVSSDSRNWGEANNESDKKDTDNSIKADSVENSDINVVSTSLSSVSNSELPDSNMLFSESEMKQDKLENTGETSNDNTICNEPIVSSTPDSPDSPEPSNVNETCEPSIDEINIKATASNNEINDSSENDNLLPSCENNPEVVEQEEEEEEKKLLDSENTDEIIESSSNSDITETSLISEEMPGINSEEIQQPDDGKNKVVESKIDDLSPENVQQPDSSNDSFHSGGDNSRESDLNLQVGNVDNDVSNNSDPSSERNISSGIIDVASCQTSVTIHEVAEEVGGGDEGENSNEELIVKEIVEDNDETVISSKLEEMKESDKVSEENIVIAASEEAVASSDECVSIEEISELKDVDEGSNIQTGVVESSNESCEQDRREGSIIHVTPSVAEAEQSSCAVEDICVDQSSCGVVEEEEAMDVDETSNQQMIMSESETEGGEPMDQSEQSQS